MQKKWFLFIGITFLVTGIALRLATDHIYLAIPIILMGTISKSYYLRFKIKQSSYKPGIEMLVLALGLVLFFTGIYLRVQNSPIHPSLFIIPGILLKITFIVLFIRKLSKKKASKITG